MMDHLHLFTGLKSRPHQKGVTIGELLEERALNGVLDHFLVFMEKKVLGLTALGFSQQVIIFTFNRTQTLNSRSKQSTAYFLTALSLKLCAQMVSTQTKLPDK